MRLLDGVSYSPTRRAHASTATVSKCMPSFPFVKPAASTLWITYAHRMYGQSRATNVV